MKAGITASRSGRIFRSALAMTQAWRRVPILATRFRKASSQSIRQHHTHCCLILIWARVMAPVLMELCYSPFAVLPCLDRAFHQTIGVDKTIWCHNGAWQPGSPYRKTYEFAGERGPPQGPELWQHLFAANKQWGLSTINQDHVGEQIGETPTAFTNVSVLKSWFKGQGDAASTNGIGVMYCCAPPNVHMNGVTVPSAYMVRASPDYVWLAGNPLHVYPSKSTPLPTAQWGE